MDNLTSLEQSLQAYAAEISVCLENSEWDKLLTVLHSRQNFLRQILAREEDIAERESVCKLMLQVLAEDDGSLAKIEAHKNKLIELHALMDQGMRAIKAYRGK